MKYQYLKFDKKLESVNLENLGEQGYRLVGFSRNGNNYDYIFIREQFEPETVKERARQEENILEEIAREASKKMAFMVDEMARVGVGTYELRQTPRITEDGLIIEFEMKRKTRDGEGFKDFQ